MTTATSTLQITTVPADHPHLAARIRDWTDRAQVHKAVMSLFPSTLPGDQGQRRAGGGILYRPENSPSGRPRLLIQHTSPLREPLPDTRSTPLQPFLDRLTPGRVIRFRIDLNAVRLDSRTRKRVPVRNTYHTPGTPLPNDIDKASVVETFTGAITIDRLTPYLTGKLHDALTHITLHDEPAVTVHRTGCTPLHIVAFMGHATIANADHLRTLVTKGIGKAKPYGCGLLSLAPAPAGRQP